MIKKLLLILGCVVIIAGVLDILMRREMNVFVK